MKVVSSCFSYRTQLVQQGYSVNSVLGLEKVGFGGTCNLPSGSQNN